MSRQGGKLTKTTDQKSSATIHYDTVPKFLQSSGRITAHILQKSTAIHCNLRPEKIVCNYAFMNFIFTGKCNEQSDIVVKFKGMYHFQVEKRNIAYFFDIEIGREFDFPSFKGNSLRWWQSNN